MTTLAAPQGAAAAPSCSATVLSHGSRESCVATAQRHLGVRADGVFGSGTRTPVLAYQQSHSIFATGSIGSATRRSLTGTAAGAVATGLSSAIPRACAPYAKAGVICASKSAKKLWWIKNNTIQRTLDARFGAPGYPTKNGVFRVYWKARTYTSKMYNAKMPFSLFYDQGRAVHFSYAFSGGDNGGSKGCIRLRSWSGAQALFNAAPVGTYVVVF